MKQGPALADGVVEVKFKPLTGREDQAGGHTCGVEKDGENYYVARANALENNISLYYTERRAAAGTIKYVDAPECRATPWHTLRAEFKGTGESARFSWTAPRRYIELDDNHIRRVGRGRRVDQGGQRDRSSTISLTSPHREMRWL